MELRAVEQVRLGQILSRPAALPGAQVALLALTGLFALASLYRSPYPDLAPLQNLPTLAILTGLALLLRWRPLPTSAVACFCAFLWLHTLGGRYAYSYVPYDAWFAAIGLPEPGEVLGRGRNAYDRLVHIAFGLLLVHPIAQFLGRHVGARPRAGLCIAVALVYAGSAVYEVFEWLLTLVMADDNAEAYNGQQGDMWDAQKDMACAVAGALVAAIWLELRERRRGVTT